MDINLYDRIYNTCFHIASNSIPWKVVDNKPIHLPPKCEVKIIDWIDGVKNGKYDIVFVSDFSLVEDWIEFRNEINNFIYPYGKIYIICKDTKYRKKFINEIGLPLIDERTIGDTLHFVFRPTRVIDKPLWAGQQNCSVLVCGGWGFGDNFHNGRFIDYLHQYNNSVTFEVRPELFKFMKCFSNCDNIILNGEAVNSPEDFKLDMRTSRQVFADRQLKIPYFNVRDIPDHLLLKTKNIKIGFVYEGGFTKHNKVRKFDISQMKKLVETKANLYCLQKHFDYEAVKPQPEDWYEDLSNSIDDWYDTACYVSQMDYIVTPDTSMLHLASSLGIKTRVILNQDHTNDYIHLNDSHSTDYPNVLMAYWDEHAMVNIVDSIRRDMICC